MNSKELLNNIIPDFFSTFFIFPFSYELFKGNYFSMQLFDDKLVFDKYGFKWKNIKYNIKSGEQYNEFFYFHPHLRNIIFDRYDQQNKSSNILFFQLVDGSDNGNLNFEYNVRYFNKENYIYKEKEIELPLKNIYLHLFDQGIGMLIFHIEYKLPEYEINKDYSKHYLKDYLKFLGMGRRIYPPFIDFKNEIDNEQIVLKNNWETNEVEYCFFKNELPLKISILNNKNNLINQDFKEFTLNKDEGCNLIENEIINNFLKPKKKNLIKFNSLLDDRMFTISYYSIRPDLNYYNNYFIEQLKIYFENTNDLRNENTIEALKIYYQIVFIDIDEPTCPNVLEMKKILNDSTYKRWSSWGSIYGFSRYSCAFISNYKEADYIYNHFQTMYYQISILLFYYRGILLKFSERSAKIAIELSKKNKSYHETYDELNNLHKDFLLFRNKYLQKEITPQDQGIELFDLWESKMRNHQLLKDLEEKIQQLFNYFDSVNEKELNRNVIILTIIGMIVIPITIVTGIWGMNDTYEIYKILQVDKLLPIIFILGLLFTVSIVSIILIFGKSIKRLFKKYS